MVFTPVKTTPKLLHVQALRALAAMFVVVTHALNEVSEILARKGVYFNEKIFPGDFGVDIFFIVSGFIMVYVSRNTFGLPGNRMAFLRRRLIRIVPVYWLITTAVLLIVIVAPSLMNNASDDPLHWLASYLFVPMARPTDGLIRPLLSLGWTLQYELFFYILFAWALMLPLTRAVPAVVSAIGAIVLAGMIFQPQIVILRFLSDPVMLEFAAGALLGWAFVDGRRLPSSLFWPAIIVALFALSLAPDFSRDVEIWRVGFYGLPALAIVGVSVLTRRVNERPVPAVLVKLGASSYALYLVHPFVLGLFTLMWSGLGVTDLLGLSLAPWIYVAVALIICPIGGHLLHLGFEKPVSRWLQKRRAPRAEWKNARAATARH